MGPALLAIVTAFALLAGLVAGPVRPAEAGNLRVFPVRLVLAPRQRSSLLVIRNPETAPVRIQLSAFRWDQDPGGEDRLVPTEDLIVFPPLLTLRPNAERRIRIGTLTARAATEQAYRILIEPLPSAPSSGGGHGAPLTLVTRLSIPVFLPPAGAQPAPPRSRLALEHGRLTVVLSNPGPVHLPPQSIRITGYGATGQSLLDGELSAWYLLPGRSRTFEIPIPPDKCPTVTTVAVTIGTDAAARTQRLEVAPGACAP